MMKCCARLIGQSNPLQRKWVKFVMTNAIEDGCVGDMVMRRFCEAATLDLFQERNYGWCGQEESSRVLERQCG